jgi:hypothetical protein
MKEFGTENQLVCYPAYESIYKSGSSWKILVSPFLDTARAVLATDQLEEADTGVARSRKQPLTATQIDQLSSCHHSIQQFFFTLILAGNLPWLQLGSTPRGIFGGRCELAGRCMYSSTACGACNT